LINLTVLPLQFTYGSFRFIPPFWSVAIEIDMYLLLFLIVSRRMSWALIALAAGLSFQLACLYDAIGWGLEYFTAPSAVLPFAVGALLYFVRGRWTAPPLAAGCAFAAWIANMVAGDNQVSHDLGTETGASPRRPSIWLGYTGTNQCRVEDIGGAICWCFRLSRAFCVNSVLKPTPSMT
jgi:peptidoglycan/LPS O-acetylase OafA/YrhL